MSLSDKAENMGGTKNWFFEEDVKDFVKLLKIKLVGIVSADEYVKIVNNIDKLAGRELLENKE